MTTTQTILRRVAATTLALAAFAPMTARAQGNASAAAAGMGVGQAVARRLQPRQVGVEQARIRVLQQAQRFSGQGQAGPVAGGGEGIDGRGVAFEQGAQQRVRQAGSKQISSADMNLRL